MKITDDPAAKLKFWLKYPQRMPMPRPLDLPAFPAQKFDSYEAFNRWKRGYLALIARQGGVKWTMS